MMRLRSLLLVAGAGLALACGGEQLPGSMPCESDAPPAMCGETCTDNAACGDGLYCSGGECTAECRYMGREGGCPGGETCSVDGQCEAN